MSEGGLTMDGRLVMEKWVHSNCCKEMQQQALHGNVGLRKSRQLLWQGMLAGMSGRRTV